MPTDVRLYWESCVFIDLLEKTPGRFEHLAPIVEEAERGGLTIVTSTLSLCEVVSLRHLSTLVDDEIEDRIRDYFENPYLYLKPVDRFVAERARSIAREYRIKPLDSVHVASAIMLQAPIMHTYDGKLLGLTQRIQGLRIERPGGSAPNSVT